MSMFSRSAQRTRSDRLIESHRKSLERDGLALSTHDVVSRASRILRERGFHFDQIRAAIVVRRVYETDDEGRELYHRAPKSETPTCVVTVSRMSRRPGTAILEMREVLRADGSSFLAALQTLTSWADNRRAS